MSNITRAHRLTIYDTDESTVDLQFDDGDLQDLPQFGGWKVKPLDGSATSSPFNVTVLDTSEQISSALADANGRLDLIGRLWELEVNKGGAGLATVAQGRVKEVRLGQGVAEYEFALSDERFRERQYDFGGDVSDLGDTTTQIFPPGINKPWFAVSGTFTAAPLTCTVDKVNSNEIRVRIPSGHISRTIFDWLEADLKKDAARGSSGGSTGNFTHLRANIDGTDREVLSLSQDLAAYQLNEFLGNDGWPARVPNVWVAWPSSGKSAGDSIELYLHAPTAPASNTVPFHVGGAVHVSGGGSDGVDPIAWLKDRYDDAGVRYDADAFSTYNASTNPNGLLDHPDIPRMWFRIDRVWNLAEFADRLYQTLGLAPFPSSTGALAPRFVLQPSGIDPTGLTTVTDSDLREPHPTFSQRGDEAITVVRGSMDIYSRVSEKEQRESAEYPADLVLVNPDNLRPLPIVMGGVPPSPDLGPIESDRITDLGRQVHDIPLLGRRSPFHYTEAAFFERMARQILDRWQDGPVYGTAHGLSAMDDVQAGDFIVLNADRWPDPVNQTRGGPRVVQILSRRFGPFGTFEFLDAGPDSQALSAPTVTLAANSSHPKHRVDATITGLPAGADRYVLQVKRGSGGHWEDEATGTANETITLTAMPSGTTISAQVKATAEKRISSAWSAIDTQATTALTAPSALSSTVAGGQVTVTWTNNEPDYAVHVRIDSEPAVVLPPGSSRYTFHVNDTSAHTVGVKVVDEYGGTSTEATTSITGATQAALPTLAAVYLLQGEVDDVPAYPRSPTHGVGVEWGVWRGAPGAELIVQYDTDSAFPDPTTKSFAGSRAKIELPADGTRRYFRFRLEQKGLAVSKWSPSVGGRLFRAIPAPFTAEPPADVNATVLHEVKPAWVYDAANEVYYLELDIRPGSGVVSCRVKMEDGPSADYSFNLAAQGTAERHRVVEDDGSGGASATDLAFTATDTDVAVSVYGYDGADGENGDGNPSPVVTLRPRDPTADTIGALRSDVHTKRVDVGTSISGNWQPNFTAGAVQKAQLSGNTTLQVPSNWKVGETMLLWIDLNGHALSFATGFYGDNNASAASLSGIVGVSLAYVDDSPSTLIAAGILDNLSAL